MVFEVKGNYLIRKEFNSAIMPRMLCKVRVTTVRLLMTDVEARSGTLGTLGHLISDQVRLDF